MIPLPVPGSELNKLKLTAYSPGFDSAGLVHRNFTPLPQPGSQLNKLKLTTYSPTLETSGLFQRNFIPLPQPGSELNKLKLTTFESQGGGFGSYVLRRFVMVAFP